MAEEYGANIATRAGEGSANVWHWEGVQKSLNQLYQRDLYHQKLVQDEYSKAQVQLSNSAKGIRAADIPDYQKAYGQFRDASLKLSDKKVFNNPDQRAYFSKLKDDAFSEALSLAERSKQAAKTKADYYNNWMQSGGLNASDDFHEKMNMYDAMSVNHIRDTHFDNPMNFFNPKDDTPSDLPKKVLGEQAVDQIRTPVIENGMKVGDNVEEIYNYKQPLGVIAKNAIGELTKSKSLTRNAREEFGSIPPEQVKQKIDTANQLIAKEGGTPLPYDYSGYFTADFINQARTPRSAGTKKFEYDQNYLMNKREDAQIKQLNIREAHQDKRTQMQMSQAERHFQQLHKDAIAGVDNADVTPVYDALAGRDRDVAMKALSALAANNPSKPIPVTISRLDILDENKVRPLLNAFGINSDELKVPISKHDTPQKRRDRFVEAALNAINEKSSGDKINLNDLSQGKIVGALVHVGQYNERDADNNYKGTKQTRLPIILNPHSSSPEQLKAILQNEAVNKKKPAIKEQAKALSEIHATTTTKKHDPLGIF